MRKDIVNIMKSYRIYSLRESDKTWTKLIPEPFITPRKVHSSALTWFLFLKFNTEVKVIEELSSDEFKDFKLIDDQGVKYFRLIFKSPHKDKYCRYGIVEVSNEI